MFTLCFERWQSAPGNTELNWGQPLSHWHLESLNWLDALPEPAQDRLRQRAQTKLYKNKETIFAPEVDPEQVYILEKGLTRIFRSTESGGEFTLGFVEPGEVFGELPVLNNASRESFAVAIDNCCVLKLPKSLFLDLMGTMPDFSLAVSRQVGKRLQRIEIRAEDLIFRSATSRIARVISMLVDDFGQADDNHVLVHLKLTQAEIATLAGCSRPTASLAIADFRKQGLLDLRSGHITVFDVDALRDIAAATTHS